MPRQVVENNRIELRVKADEKAIVARAKYFAVAAPNDRNRNRFLTIALVCEPIGRIAAGGIIRP